jgi:hypothetical protein
MNDPDIEQFIIKELGGLQRPERLIPIVCERTGLDWTAAKEFIEDVQKRHSEAILKRKRWFSLDIASVSITMGFWMTIIAGYRIVHFPAYPIGFITLTCFGGGILMLGGGLIGIFKIK